MDTLPEEKQEEVLDLAVKRRLTVAKECKEYNEELSEKRRKQMLEEHSKKMALLKKAQEERDKLSHLHIITSSDELSQCIQRIDDENCSSSKKKKKTVCIITRTNKYQKKGAGSRYTYSFLLGSEKETCS